MRQYAGATGVGGYAARRAGTLSRVTRFYRKKRDVLVNALAQSRLKVLPCEGTYFLLIDYSAVSTLNDVEFCQWLTEEVGVAAIPLSVFCAAPFPHQLIRLCFAKQESTLLAAADRLCKL
ncbi:aminotransferase class I/II-fold pyridoxal phosphate-dependent enzyme [Salmonella enterica]